MENEKLAQELEPVIAKLEQTDDEEEIRVIFEDAVGTAEGEELDESDLENVVGGVLTEWKVLKWLLKHTKSGKLTWKATKMVARCFYDYAKYGNAYRTYSKKELQKVNADLDAAMPGWMKKINNAFK